VQKFRRDRGAGAVAARLAVIWELQSKLRRHSDEAIGYQPQPWFGSPMRQSGYGSAGPQIPEGGSGECEAGQL